MEKNEASEGGEGGESRRENGIENMTKQLEMEKV